MSKLNSKFPKSIIKPFDYTFSISQNGLYAITITASCQSGKQIGMRGGENLRLEIDSRKLREVPAESRPQYKDIPSTWDGTKLKGLSKTVVFVLWLNKGDHLIQFLADHGAVINQEPKVQFIEDATQARFSLEDQAEDGDRRPWYTFVLVDLPLKEFSADILVKWRGVDSDDVKLIVDSKIKKNNLTILHRDWLWSANIFKKLFQQERQKKSFDENLDQGVHYLEFWADRMPTLHRIELEIPLKTTEEVSIQIQPYYQGIAGNEDYNRFDKEIVEAVNFWNEFFQDQKYSPPKPLDPNLVKAMIYKESRMGYATSGFPDVMQVGDERNPAIHSIRGEKDFYANEFISETKIGHMSYSYPKRYLPPKVESPSESIFWGVRWLYHKTQYLKQKTNRELIYPYIREWNSWQQAVIDYNGNPKLKYEYQKDVWKIYQEGIDPDGNVLWQKKKVSKSKKVFFGLSLIICLILLGGFFYFKNKTLAEELPWNVKIVRIHSLNPSNEFVVVLQDTISARIGLAVLDKNLKFKQWLPNGKLISPGFSDKVVGEYFDWWQIGDINQDGFLDIAIQLQLSGTSLTHPFYLYQKQPDSFGLLLYLADGVSETELVDLDGDGMSEIIHSFALDPTNLTGRTLTPLVEIWTWRDNHYQLANHLFPGFSRNYQKLSSPSQLPALKNFLTKPQMPKDSKK